MASTKFYNIPFARDGNKAAVPNPTQVVTGSVSYQEGWGIHYQEDLSGGPPALPIDRQQTNQMFYDLTFGMQQYQSVGTPPFISSARNDGAPYSYSKWSYAMYDPGSGDQIYQSKTNANTSIPTTVANWRLCDNNSEKIIFDNVSFGGGVVQGNVVYWDGGAGLFRNAVANGTAPQEAIGIADVTLSRVYQSGLCPIMSGLTPGATYYLSTTTPGAITTTFPPNNAVEIGTAKSATEIFLEVDERGASIYDVQSGANLFGTTSGAGNNYTLSLTPNTAVSIGPTYENGFRVNFACHATNTGASTLNVDGRGAIFIKTITNGVVSDLRVNQLKVGVIYTVIYFGGFFYLDYNESFMTGLSTNPGFIRLGNQIYMQWGINAIPGAGGISSSAAVVFPVAFLGVIGVYLSVGNNSGSGVLNVVNYNSLTNGGFSLHGVVNVAPYPATAVSWMALGVGV